MADYDIPQSLIDSQIAFLKAEQHCQELIDAEPAATAIAAGEAEISEEQRKALAEAREYRLQKVEALMDHPAWQRIPKEDRIKVQIKVRAAAEAALSTPAG
jgi:hypothetical protein